jgi:amidase
MSPENDTTWMQRVADKRRRQLEAIPKEWLIEPPSQDILNVTEIPTRSEILTPKEVEITECLDVDALLAKLASGEWSSVEVTTAFYKRAIIAHRLVSTSHLQSVFNRLRIVDQLSNGDFCRESA